MSSAQSHILFNNTFKRISFLISALLLQYLISYLMDPYSSYWETYFHRNFLYVIVEWFLSFLFCLSLYESIRFIGLKLNKILPWTKNPNKRILIESLSTFSIVLFLNFLITVSCVFFSDDPVSLIGMNMSIEEAKGLIQWMVSSFIIAFIIMGVNIANQLIIDWKNEALRASKSNQIATEAELQALKSQIDPHFVFNNLSVLSELILENQQLGYEYTENFSKIYRYMLVNSKKNLISVQDELRFLDSYIFLIKQRIGEGVDFEIEVDSPINHLYMPPLTLQLLVENALKHNKTIKATPLSIKIYSNSKQELIIENSLLPIEKTLASSGIGIENIEKRYKLLSKRVPEIIKTDTSFRVTIPLINYD